MTLRTRLVLALLTVALLPTVVFALFTLDQLVRATERWFSPAVERSLQSSLEVSRTSLLRLESTVLAQADAFAAGWPRGGPDAARRAAARDELRSAGVDFLQVYDPDGGGWRLREQISAAGLIVPEPADLGASLGAALEGERIVRSDRGVLGGVARTADGRALVAGMWMPREFFSQLDQVGEGIANYRRLAVVVDLQRRRHWLQVSALAVALAGLALFLALSLSRQMTRPLRRLSDALGGVARGELETRVEPDGAPEMRTLGQSFNAMAEGLSSARDALKEAEREAAWREVAQRLAHEFKNILTPMSLSLHRLRRRAESVPPDQREAVRESLAALGRGVDQMSRLAEQFSQYARLPEPRFEPLDLSEVVRSAAQLHEHEGVDVAVREGGPLRILGDSLLLSRAIHNLLLNACEASPSGATVEVRTAAEGDRAVVEILDRGPGVPEQVLARLFEPYVSTKRRGSGLGLSLVRDIALRHRGTVTLANREGGGACARLALPREGDARE